MSLTDNRLLDVYGNPLPDISCGIFKEMDKDKNSKEQLKNYYLRKPLGIDEYYNKLLKCTNKNKDMYEKRLKMVKDPKYMNNVTKNKLENLKVEEIELRKKIRGTKKSLKNICTKKSKFFCRLTNKKINKIMNSKNKNDILNVKRFLELKDGIDVCNNNNICMDFRMSLSNIPRNTRYFYMTVQDSLLSPLIKQMQPVLSSMSQNKNSTQTVQPQQPMHVPDSNKSGIKNNLMEKSQSLLDKISGKKNKLKVSTKKGLDKLSTRKDMLKKTTGSKLTQLGKKKGAFKKSLKGKSGSFLKKGLQFTKKLKR